MPTKTVNYTVEQVKQMLSVYDPEADQETRDQQVNKLADEFGKKRRSIINKLAREKVYVKLERLTKTGTKVVQKSELVADIAKMVGVEAGKIVSLAKGTKSDLQALKDALQID